MTISSRDFDVIISGAELAEVHAPFLVRGKKAQLFEKEMLPRDKICADNKTWNCMDVAKELFS